MIDKDLTCVLVTTCFSGLCGVFFSTYYSEWPEDFKVGNLRQKGLGRSSLKMHTELRGVEIFLNWVYVVVAAITATLCGI